LFLTVAVQMCRPNATVVLCQPAMGTRPGVDHERVALLEVVSSLGLRVDAVQSAAVRYVTPHFEAVSLRAAGHGVSIPTSWRRGDVLLLKRTDATIPPDRAATFGQEWHEVSFGPVCLKLSRLPTGLDLGELVAGDILPTVSRRDPLQRRIGLWTSGNRVFTVEHPDAIGELVKLCDADLASQRFSLSRTIAQARTLGLGSDVATRLFAVLRTELAEHTQLGGEHYERG